MVLGKTRFGGFFFVHCRSELAPGGVPTKDVNDNACCLKERTALEYIAGKPVSHIDRMRFGCRMVNRLHQIAGMSSVYASPRRLFWIHQLSSRMHSGSRMIDHRPGWP
mgnify:FL=1